MRICIILIGHAIGIGLLIWGGWRWNPAIIKYTHDYAGVITILSVTFGVYTALLNFMYHKSQAFHLFINRIIISFSRTHTYWKPHMAFRLREEPQNTEEVFGQIWKYLSDGKHGHAVQTNSSLNTMTISLDNLMVLRLRLDEDNLYADFGQKLLVPSHLYDIYRKKLARMAEDIMQAVDARSVQCALRIDFADGKRNPYYGFFVNRVPPKLLQEFKATFRLRADSHCRIEAGKDHVNIESDRLSEAFDGLDQVLNLRALPSGDMP